MSRVECFMVERVSFAREYWRVWSDIKGTTKACTHGGESHYARVVANESVPYESSWLGEGRPSTPEEQAGPRYPKGCDACGKAFGPGDWHYRDLEPLYRMPDGTLVTFREAPAGAMRLWTPPDRKWDWVGPDGMELSVKLPDGVEWSPDRPAGRSGTPWQRTGVAPKFTANPSIVTDKYHGWLRDGFLVEC